MFVPYYTQANLRSYTELESGGREALLKAYNDVKQAFIYYMEHHNNGRPIIIAGHSQGSTHGMLLLKDFFDGTELQEQLVCAYLPGIGLHENEFKSIPFLKKMKLKLEVLLAGIPLKGGIKQKKIQNLV